MPTITLKNIPRDLHRRLKARAAHHQRSLNSEVMACLKAAVSAAPIDPEELLARARALRGKISGRLTDRDLDALKSEGRL